MAVLVYWQTAASAPTATHGRVPGGNQGDLDLVLPDLKIGYLKSLPEREAGSII